MGDHSECGRDRCPGVAGAIAVVLAFGAEEKAVEPFVLPNRVDLIPPSGKHLVDISLVADVEDKFVVRGIKNPVQSDRQLDNTEIRTEVSPRFRQ